MSESKGGDFRVIIADPLLPDGIETLRAAPGLAVEDHTESDREALRDALEGASALIVRSRTKVTPDLIESADRLRVVGRAGVGVDNIDIPAATRRGIAVLNAPAANTQSTAELAFALLLAAARRITEADASIRAGEWRRKELRGIQLSGKTLGVIGLGRIGAEVVWRARAFGMRVVAHDPFVSADRASDLGVELASLDELLPACHAITLHVPLSEENRGFIGRKELAAMRPGSILVNAARGGLVDEAALAEALGSGHLGAAGLDVFETEPLPADSPLRDAPQLVFSPHLGASTYEAQRQVSRQIAISVRDALVDGDYSAALNAPFEAEDRDGAGPIMDLGYRLGRLLAGLEDAPPSRIDVRYGGPRDGVLGPLAASVAVGFLERRVDPPLNVVNALSIAAERGLEIVRVRTQAVGDYTNYVELSAASGRGRGRGRGRSGMVVGGALMGARMEPRIVRVGTFRIETEPRGTCLLIRNRDQPGVIGGVGTVLGEANANIAEYHLARRKGGGQSFGVVRIDEELPAKTLRELEDLDGVEEVRQVNFD
ncbi:phosphoglycerate dehydrogenase [Candidatus Palauibacter sp.]|uniref:phosphoglycerate dehydrogenase n=1 Tax=Candidatus Palauibacter sp. TaxID=3101350 RepID=UPI003D101419